jgi:hypothetical protein
MTAKLPATPEAWANRLTQMLNLFQKVHRQPRFPVDVASIAMDVSRQFFPDEPITMVEGLPLSPGVEAALMPRRGDSGEWGIVYNDTIASRGRRNFGLAHELGHYFLHRQHLREGRECAGRDMGEWRNGRQRTPHEIMEAEANTFASYLLMPLDDFRDQMKGRTVDIDTMTAMSERYGVSLTAAILKWLSMTDRRAMIVVGRDGFIDWAWSSAPLIKTGIYYAARHETIEVPPASMAAQGAAPGTARNGVTHAPGIWRGSEPVREMTVFSSSNEMTISLLLYPERAPTASEMAALEVEDVPDTFDRFMDGGSR